MFLFLTGLLRYWFQNEKATFSGTGFRFFCGVLCYFLGWFFLKAHVFYLCRVPREARWSPGGDDANRSIFTGSVIPGPALSPKHKPVEETSSESVKLRDIRPGLGNLEPGAGRGRQGGWRGPSLPAGVVLTSG